MRLLLLRHGAVDETAAPRGVLLGRRDVALAEQGRAQARLWGQALAGLPIDSFVTSPLGRARETAEVLARAAGWGQTAAPVATLAEIDLGAWDGLDRAAVEARFPGGWAARGQDMAGYRPPGGESFADVAARLGPWLESLPAGTTLAVSHAGVIRVAVCLALGLNLGRVLDLGLERGSLTVLEHSSAGRWRLAGLNLPAGSPLPASLR